MAAAFRKRASFPEIDRAEFFDVETARRKINSAQQAFVDRLVELLRENASAQ
jgi:predicted NUDIX family NTP pyrophosphohydrolase